MPELMVRRWENTDSLDALTDLLHRAYTSLLDLGFNYSAADQTIEVTKACVEQAECYLAIRGTGIIGTILLICSGRRTKCELYNRADTAHFGKFAVAPELQGRGIGLKLLATVERRAKDLGYKNLACDTAEGATHLIRFYQKYGYQIVGRVQWEGKTYCSAVMNKELTRS